MVENHPVIANILIEASIGSFIFVYIKVVISTSQLLHINYFITLRNLLRYILGV